jgi:hypothetical protein
MRGMTQVKTFLLATILLVLASVSGAYAQGTRDNTYGSGAGTTRHGVKTGEGPLSQSIPLAVSTANPQNNANARAPLRPQNMPGPALTNPPQQPFGTRELGNRNRINSNLR